MVHTLMMVAQVDIDKDRARDARADRDALAAAAPPPPSGAAAAAGVKPPASPVELRAPAAPAAAPPAGPGDAPAAALPAAPRAPLASPALAALAADGALLGELWARLPPPARGALAASCTALALAARRVPWKRRPARDDENPPPQIRLVRPRAARVGSCVDERSSLGAARGCSCRRARARNAHVEASLNPRRRLAVQLADDHGVLCCDLDVDRDWRAYFRELWTTRRFKWGGSRGAGAFSVGAMVRFRPRTAGGAAGDTAADVFLPLHQRLQLRRLGHETGLADEVSRRLGPVGEDVETYEARARRRARDAAKNTELLRAAKGTPRGGPNDENAEPNTPSPVHDAPAPAPAPAAPDDAAAPAAPGAAAPEAAAPPRDAFAAAASVSARVVSTEPTRVLVGVPGSGLVYYDFERVLDAGATQAATYGAAAAPLVRSFCDGLNGCLLAYGQTGSGKTHTMFGPPGALDAAAASPGSRLGADAGVVPRVLADVLGAIAAAKSRGAAVDARLSFSYLELYQERLTDLVGGGDVKLYRVGRGIAADEYRERTEGCDDVVLNGATHFDATAEGDAAAWSALAAAEARKVQAATAMNARSSRAHTIFGLTLAQSCRGKVLTSKLFLVDLGGSEQVKKSKAEGERFREAVTINKSLVALGRVVDALVNKNEHHVPYYESKLTTLLQPAFGGNSKTVVLVSASPDDGDGDESLNSVRFGTRCARVLNSASAKTADMADVLASLDAQIAGARATLARLEAGGAKARALGEAGDARLRGMGAGHAAASRLQAMSHQDDTGGDVSKEAGLSTRQAHAHRGAYSHVDDDAGLYVAESDKLAALLQRKAAIVGAPAK